jgi:hypothetical protein
MATAIFLHCCSVGSTQLLIFDVAALHVTPVTTRGNDAGDSSQPPLAPWFGTRSPRSPCASLVTLESPHDRPAPHMRPQQQATTSCARPMTWLPPSPHRRDSGESSANSCVVARDEVVSLPTCLAQEFSSGE